MRRKRLNGELRILVSGNGARKCKWRIENLIIGYLGINSHHNQDRYNSLNKYNKFSKNTYKKCIFVRK